MAASAAFADDAQALGAGEACRAAARAALAAQTATMLAFAAFVTVRLTGRDYMAAMIGSAHQGIGISATPTAVANMEAITRRFGPAPTVFIVILLTGAFFIDLANALLLGGRLALPFLGFPW